MTKNLTSDGELVRGLICIPLAMCDVLFLITSSLNCIFVSKCNYYSYISNKNYKCENLQIYLSNKLVGSSTVNDVEHVFILEIPENSGSVKIVAKNALVTLDLAEIIVLGRRK